MFKLLSTANPKIQKGTERGYLSFILHLAPSTLSGHNTCPKATKGCTAACLNTAGRGGMFKRGETTNVIQKARIRKTNYFYDDRAGFMFDLMQDIKKGIRLANKLGLEPVFRLNGTSDLSWEKYSMIEGKNVFDVFAGIQFYDYTKDFSRMLKPQAPNYHLTYSVDERAVTKINAATALSSGLNVAMVFNVKDESELPAEYMGFPVINGDEHDLTFLHGNGVIVGLKAKGKAKKDNSGFVIQL